MWKDKALFVSDQHDRIKEREKLLGYIVNPQINYRKPFQYPTAYSLPNPHYHASNAVKFKAINKSYQTISREMDPRRKDQRVLQVFSARKIDGSAVHCPEEKFLKGFDETRPLSTQLLITQNSHTQNELKELMELRQMRALVQKKEVGQLKELKQLKQFKERMQSGELRELMGKYERLREQYSFLLRKQAENDERISELVQQNSKHQQQIERNRQYKVLYEQCQSQIKTLKADLIMQQHALTESKPTSDIFKTLGTEYQQKVLTLNDEIYRLKNEAEVSNSRIQELETQNRSYQITLQAFEDRDKSCASNAMQGELKRLQRELQTQKEEKDNLISQYELQIMNLQNEIDNLRVEKTGSILGDCKQEKLLQNLKDMISETEILRKKVAEQSQLIMLMKNK